MLKIRLIKLKYNYSTVPPTLFSLEVPSLPQVYNTKKYINNVLLSGCPTSVRLGQIKCKSLAIKTCNYTFKSWKLQKKYDNNH